MANVRAGGWLFSKPYSSRYAQFVPPHSGGVNLFTFFFESGAHYVFQFKLLNVLTNVRMQVACRHESFSSDNEGEQIQFNIGRSRKT